MLAEGGLGSFLSRMTIISYGGGLSFRICGVFGSLLSLDVACLFGHKDESDTLFRLLQQGHLHVCPFK